MKKISFILFIIFCVVLTGNTSAKNISLNDFNEKLQGELLKSFDGSKIKPDTKKYKMHIDVAGQSMIWKLQGR